MFCLRPFEIVERQPPAQRKKRKRRGNKNPNDPTAGDGWRRRFSRHRRCLLRLCVTCGSRVITGGKVTRPGDCVYLCEAVSYDTTDVYIQSYPPRDRLRTYVRTYGRGVSVFFKAWCSDWSYSNLCNTASPSSRLLPTKRFYSGWFVGRMIRLAQFFF